MLLSLLLKRFFGSVSVAGVFVFLVVLQPHTAFAAERSGSLVNIVNWYYILAEALFHSHERAEYWWPVFSAIGGFLFVTGLGYAAGLYKLVPEKMTDEELLPPARFSARAFVEICWSAISSTLATVIGEGRWQRFAPLLGGTFFFIIICNISGLIPGLAPATEEYNTTVAMALFIFISFNVVGIYEAGWGYIKHLFGPLIWLAPLIFLIEVVALIARPISLSLRLMGNVWGDHLVYRIFASLMQALPFLPVPALLLAFGTLVACMQAFIFMTLSAVYMRLALDTAHHHEDH